MYNTFFFNFLWYLSLVVLWVKHNYTTENWGTKVSCWDYHIHPHYKNNTNEVMSLFLNTVENIKKRKLCGLLWVGNHQNVSQIVHEVHTNNSNTFSGILGNGLRKCNLCARNVYSLQYYFQCPQAPNKNLKALSHDSNQHSPNALNHI